MLFLLAFRILKLENAVDDENGNDADDVPFMVVKQFTKYGRHNGDNGEPDVDVVSIFQNPLIRTNNFSLTELELELEH